MAGPNGKPAKYIDLQKLAFAFLDSGVALQYLRPLLGIAERIPNPDIEEVEILVNYLPDNIHKRFQFGSTLYPNQPSDRMTDSSFLLSPFKSYKAALGPPPILAVCRESRSFALEHYRLAFTSNTLFGTYFHFKIDTLSIRSHQIDEYGFEPRKPRRATRIANYLHRPTHLLLRTLEATEDIEWVRFLAVEVASQSIGPGFGVKHSWQQVDFSSRVASLLRVLPNTEKMTILVHSIGNKSYNPRIVEPIDFSKALSHYKKSLASIVGNPNDLELELTAFSVGEEELTSHLDKESLEEILEGELPEIEYKFAMNLTHQKRLDNLIKACNARMVDCNWTLGRKV